jgi:hypothetical protein
MKQMAAKSKHVRSNSDYFLQTAQQYIVQASL